MPDPIQSRDAPALTGSWTIRSVIPPEAPHEDRRPQHHSLRLERHSAPFLPGPGTIRPDRQAEPGRRTRPGDDPHRRGDRGPFLPRHGGEHRGTAAAADAQADRDGARPAGQGAALPGDAGAPVGGAALGGRRRRRRALGPRRQGGGGADPPVARHLPGEAAGVRQFRAAAERRGLRRPGALIPGQRLAGLQDPPLPRLARRHGDLPCRAQGGGRRLPADARFDLGLRLSAGAAGRQADRGTRLRVVRGPARRPGHLQLHEAAPAAPHPDPGDRVPRRLVRLLRALDLQPGDGLPAR